MLHEVTFHRLKGLFHAFTDRDTRHHDNKLAPAVTLVQLKHGLDIDIGFAGTGFHLDIKAAPAEVIHQRRRFLDVIRLLYLTDILQQLIVTQFDNLIFIAGVVFVVQIIKAELLMLRIERTQIAVICNSVIIPLTTEHLHNSIHRVGLILLDFVIELHGCTVILYFPPSIILD